MVGLPQVYPKHWCQTPCETVAWKTCGRAAEGVVGMQGMKPPCLNWGTVITAWPRPGQPLSGSRLEGSSSGLEAVTSPSQSWS